MRAHTHTSQIRLRFIYASVYFVKTLWCFEFSPYSSYSLIPILPPLMSISVNSWGHHGIGDQWGPMPSPAMVGSLLSLAIFSIGGSLNTLRCNTLYYGNTNIIKVCFIFTQLRGYSLLVLFYHTTVRQWLVKTGPSIMVLILWLPFGSQLSVCLQT